MKMNKSKINQKVCSNLAVVTLASPQMNVRWKDRWDQLIQSFAWRAASAKILDSSSARGWGPVARDYIPS